MMNFTPSSWYWLVAGDTTRVFSSASGDYVPAADPTFAAWSAQGNVATPIDTEANLGSVLALHSLRPIPAGILDGYQAEHARLIGLLPIFRVLFNHENRLRAIERALSLNGSPPNMTQAQAIAAIKALM